MQINQPTHSLSNILKQNYINASLSFTPNKKIPTKQSTFQRHPGRLISAPASALTTTAHSTYNNTITRFIQRWHCGDSGRSSASHIYIYIYLYQLLRRAMRQCGCAAIRGIRVLAHARKKKTSRSVVFACGGYRSRENWNIYSWESRRRHPVVILTSSPSPE